LKYLDLKDCQIGQPSPNFKLKDYEIKTDPQWPSLIEFLGRMDLESLNLRDCQINHKSIELVSVALSLKPYPCKNLQILNLAKNMITKDGAKLLAPALEENKTLKYIDLSQNNLGVYGITLIAKALEKNSTLTSLNIFKNTIDVNGARAIREMLKVNQAIQFLDIGHNRIRQKGLEAISEGILAAKDCKLKTLGLRMNFINDDGFTRFFDEVILSGMSKIENLYVSRNNMSDYKAHKLQEKVKSQGVEIYVDRFEKTLYETDDRLDKTLWFQLGDCGPDAASLKYKKQLIDAFNCKKTGLIKVPIRVRVSRAVRNKTTRANCYMFVQFESEQSIANVISLVNKRKIPLLASCKAYKAGTNTFV
jgi:hypothetical protein